MATTPAPAEQPTQGGSYVLDPATGKLTKTAGTVMPGMDERMAAKRRALGLAATEPAPAVPAAEE